MVSNETEPKKSSETTLHVSNFDRIVSGEVAANILFQDEKVIVIKEEAHPVAPNHFLVIPKNRDGLTGISKAESRHKPLIGHMMQIGSKVAKSEGMDKNGYRMVVNEGKHGCGLENHFHLQFIGGK